ncbi:MAG: class II glutamine amidotransferase [Candidatus Ranarchaeia archaeon]|jgi:glutamate synthase domain-containing protein 1
MKSISFANPPPHRVGKRNHDACGIAGFINLDGRCEDGSQAKKMIETIIDRENGLGGGFAAYGLFPERSDQYCIQLLLDDEKSRESVHEYLDTQTTLHHHEVVETEPNGSIQPPVPLVHRFFVTPPQSISKPQYDDFIVNTVMHINVKLPGAFAMSSGKNMAVFKGNGWSFEVADFYRIDKYKASLWLAHSRFPTNTPGWWGGAHPFNILDWSVIHNGEITSYGTNKRFLEMYGYICTLMTDTEVVAYLWDLLVRRHELPIPIAATALAPPYYEDIDELSESKKKIVNTIRSTYGAAMLNGPFSILVGSNRPTPTLIGLTDRKKLRPLVCAETSDENTLFLSSEEAAIRATEKEVKDTWAPMAGKPVVASIGSGILRRGVESPL